MPPRSPVIFVLLLAATLSVDAVAVYLAYLAWQDTTRGAYGLITFLALIFSELGVVSIWATFARRAWTLRWGGTAAATLGTSWLAAALQRGYSSMSMFRYGYFSNMFAQFGSYVLVVSFLLWILRDTSTWRRMTRLPLGPRWRFGVKHILLLMTAFGAIIAAWRTGDDLTSEWEVTASTIIGSVILTVSAVFIYQMRTHLLMRLASLLALAGVVGALAAWLCWGPWAPWTALFLIQAIVLAAWLELVPIIPRRSAAAVDAATKTAARAPSQAE